MSDDQLIKGPALPSVMISLQEIAQDADAAIRLLRKRKADDLIDILGLSEFAK